MGEIFARCRIDDIIGHIAPEFSMTRRHEEEVISQMHDALGSARRTARIEHVANIIRMALPALAALLRLRDDLTQRQNGNAALGQSTRRTAHNHALQTGRQLA